MTRINRIVIVLAAAALIGAGCAATSTKSLTENSPVPLPSYRTGSTFVYSDGSWETVTEASPQQVSWRNHRGNTSSGLSDFTYRRSTWRNRTRQGTRSFAPRSDVMFKGTMSLWPLRIGNEARYTETGSWRETGQPERSYKTHWTVTVVGTERVAVMAGEFDTWKIIGKRYYTSPTSLRSYLKEIKTWYYAPTAGHWILSTTEYQYDKPSRRLELLAVLPPSGSLSDDAREHMEKTFQQVMEHHKSGQPLAWAIPQEGIAGEILPMGTFQLGNGTFCRRYIQRISLPDDGQRQYFGLAFRDDSGRWYVPRRGQ